MENWLNEHNIAFSFSDGWAKGGEGCIELANKVIANCEIENDFNYLYEDELPLVEKIQTIATKVYHASSVEYGPEVLEKLSVMQANYGNYPICMAKTPNSFTDDPKIVGAPENHVLHIRDVKVNTGAEFVIAYAGSVLTMPGLPKDPAACHIGFDSDGNIEGLF